MMTAVKTAEEIEAMRVSGRMLATVLDFLIRSTTSGMTTKDLALLAKEELKKLGGVPSFLGYQGFTDVICISINNQVVHGIPGPRVLKAGDILSLDFGVTYKGMITDGARTIIVPGGVKNKQDLTLVAVTEASMLAGISAVKDGCRVGDIGAAVQAVLDEKHYGIVRDLVGHGVGHELHEDPNIPNYGKPGTGMVLKTGMTIAIEPMSTLGKHQVYVADDGWTVMTRDGSKSAHFEHTVLVTGIGAEILTTL